MFRLGLVATSFFCSGVLFAAGAMKATRNASWWAAGRLLNSLSNASLTYFACLAL